MTYDSQYNNRDIEYIEHNYLSDDSSLQVDPLMLPVGGADAGWRGAHGWRGICRAGYSLASKEGAFPKREIFQT